MDCADIEIVAVPPDAVHGSEPGEIPFKAIVAQGPAGSVYVYLSAVVIAEVPTGVVTVTFTVVPAVFVEGHTLGEQAGLVTVTSVPPLPETYETFVALPAPPNCTVVTFCRFVPVIVTGVSPDV